LKKVCYKVSVCENCRRQSCKAFNWPNYPCKNNWWGTSLCTWKFGGYWPTPLHNADFQSVFTGSASAVTPSKKVKLTLIGSPLRAFQW